MFHKNTNNFDLKHFFIVIIFVALAERKSYKAQAKLRKIIAVPALSRGSVALSSLSEKDYTPVLTADLTLYSHGSIPLDHTDTPTGVNGGHDNVDNVNDDIDGDGDIDEDIDGAVDSEDRAYAGNHCSSSSSSSTVNSSKSNKRSSRTSGLHSSRKATAPEDDNLPVPLAVNFCSVCEVQVLPGNTDNHQSIVVCTVCNSQYHESCCFPGCATDSTGSTYKRIDPGDFDCKVCIAIVVTTEQSKVKRTSRANPSVNNQKTKRKVSETNSNDETVHDTESPKKTSKKRKVVGKKITKACAAPNAIDQSQQRVEESAIHPDILAALEACESYELT